MQANEISDTLTEEARGSIRAESVVDGADNLGSIIEAIAERDTFAANSIANFANQSNRETRESLIN